jgi:phosphoglycolate phosphatase
MPVSVIFDLDGTLIDSVPDIHATANRVLADEGLEAQSLPQVQSFVGRGVPHLVSRLLAAAGQTPDPARQARMVAAFLAHYETAFDLTEPFPGVPQALDRLAAAGHRLAICTNKPEAPARTVLRHLALDHHFPVIIGGDRLPQRKPDPAPLLLARRENGGGPALFVGDSDVDAETAAAAGLPFLLFTEGYRTAPVEALPHAGRFAHFGDLADLVAAHG